MRNFENQKEGAKILSEGSCTDANRFRSVAEVRGDRVLGIEEKPKNPKSNYAVIGILSTTYRLPENPAPKAVRNVSGEFRGDPPTWSISMLKKAS